jgi:hypothetical protein
MQHSTAWKNTAQHSAAQHCTAQHSTARRSTAQHSTAQHSTAQHSTAQHSTAQHSTARHQGSRVESPSQPCCDKTATNTDNNCHIEAGPAESIACYQSTELHPVHTCSFGTLLLDRLWRFTPHQTHLLQEGFPPRGLAVHSRH